MTRNEIIEKLTPIVRNDFENDNIILTDNMSADNTKEWTSLSFMTLLSDIEKEFGFKFKMLELLKLKTMNDIIASISNHIS